MSFDLTEERQFLDSLVIDYKDQTPYSKAKKDIIHELINQRIKDPSNKRVLQLGCSGGYETEFLANTFGQVDVIDGSSKFIERMKSNNQRKNLNFFYSLFEDYDFQADSYDYVFCNYILEHVYEPVAVLANVKKSIKKDGKMFAVVPNKNAFSRKLAKELGLIDNLSDLTQNDHDHGHRRTYDRAAIVDDFEKAEFKVVETAGVVFKILADFQLNEMMNKSILTEDHIFGLQKMGREDQDSCDSIFVAAKP